MFAVTYVTHIVSLAAFMFGCAALGWIISLPVREALRRAYNLRRFKRAARAYTEAHNRAVEAARQEKMNAQP